MKTHTRWNLVQGVGLALVVGAAYARFAAAGVPFGNCAVCWATFPDWYCALMHLCFR